MRFLFLNECFSVEFASQALVSLQSGPKLIFESQVRTLLGTSTIQESLYQAFMRFLWRQAKHL